MTGRFSEDVCPELLHVVQLESELALLVSSVVLVEDTTSSCLVDLLNCILVSNFCSCLIAGFNSEVELLNGGTEVVLEHLVLEGLNGNNLYALLRGLNVRHGFFLPFQIFYGLITETIRLAPERVRSSDNIIQYGILSQFVKKCKSFLKKSAGKSAKFSGPPHQIFRYIFHPDFPVLLVLSSILWYNNILS